MHCTFFQIIGDITVKQTTVVQQENPRIKQEKSRNGLVRCCDLPQVGVSTTESWSGCQLNLSFDFWLKVLLFQRWLEESGCLCGDLVAQQKRDKKSSWFLGSHRKSKNFDNWLSDTFWGLIRIDPWLLTHWNVNDLHLLYLFIWVYLQLWCLSSPNVLCFTSTKTIVDL